MVFWLILALMTAAAIIVVIRPLTRRVPAATTDADLAVYRDQLAEIDRDLARGAIAPAEAEAARVEISRRLIASAERAERDAAAPRAAAGTARRCRVASAAVLIGLPVGAIALYLALGSPGLPGQPLADRLARGSDFANSDANATLSALVARAEAHLALNPNDGRGWEVLAPIYMRLERFDEAVNARRNAIRLLGATADRVAGLGEALVASAGGIVTPDAKAAFERARELDSGNVTAPFYLGLAARQAGQREEARRIWEDLIARAPDGAEWIPFVRQALAALGEPAAGAAAPPADAAQTAGAASELTAEQRDMARGMVKRLAARLAENGSDVESWLRLVRSYLVLGETDKARAAATDARKALADDADKLRRLDNGVKALGIEG
jgi:cytochrome c-type biogenesis protein CcmH